MNGEIPSVPITTLAGIQSLTDLLPELPLPSPLPSSLSNKSLLFHPRVAEEAKRLLNTHDENLIPQLAQALAQTSTENIELTDSYIGGENVNANVPDLLNAVFARNSAVFETKKSEVTSPQSTPNSHTPSQGSKGKNASTTTTTSKQCSYPSPHESPARNSSQDSPATRGHPQESPSHLTAQQSPISSTISPQNNGQNHNLSTHSYPVTGNKVHQTINAPFTPSLQPGDSGDSRGSFNNNNCAVKQLANQISDSSQPSSLGSSPHLNSNSVNVNIPDHPCKNKENNELDTQQKQFNSFASPTAEVTDRSANSEEKHAVVNGGQSDSNSISSVVSEKNNKGCTGKTPSKNKTSPSLVPDKSSKINITKNKPVVLLNKLNVSDEALALNLMKNNSKPKEHRNESRRRSAHRKPIRIISSDEDDSDSNIMSGRKESEKYYKDRVKRRAADGKFFKGTAQKKRKISSSGDEYKPDLDDCVISLSERVKRRKRSSTTQPPTYNESGVKSEKKEPVIEDDDEEEEIPKPKFKKEKKVRKLLHEHLTTEELMDTNTFKRFSTLIEFVFESTEELDLNAEQDDDADCSADALIPLPQLEELCIEAAKLKAQSAMDQVPRDRLVRLLTVLERNIRDGAKVLPIQSHEEQDEEESRLWLELTMERVMRSVDASLTAIYIMTSPNMPKQVYLDDVIERVVTFTKFQLINTIYPVFDPAYRLDPKNKDGYVGNIKQKRARAHTVKQRSILQLYNKLSDVVQLTSDLMDLQTLPDTTVLQISTLGVSPFFVENVSELQLSSLRLVTTVFSKYDKHRHVILEDILSSLARLPSSKRNLRNYRLNSEEHIQMVTALALQLTQCVVQLPKVESELTSDSDKSKIDTANEMLIVSSYENAMVTAYYFLSVFLKKCSGKNSDELDFRPLFENFIQDLLRTVNKPEWPAAEFLLSLLGKLLFQSFSNKSLDMSLRVASLDYLGVVAARLRKDAVTSQLRQEQIDEIVHQAAGDCSDDDETVMNIRKKQEIKKQEQPLMMKSDKTQVLQKALLDYLNSNLQHDPSLLFAGNFFIAQWFKDAVMEAKVDKDSPSKSKSSSTPSKSSPKKPKKSKKKSRKRIISESEESESFSEISDNDFDNDANPDSEEKKNAEAWALANQRKKFLLSVFKINSNSSGMVSKLDYESAELVSRFLAAKRPFSKSFDIYLKQILTVLNESAVAVRTKAMKCLASVVEADPEILGRPDMQCAVRNRLLDHSTNVREAAVDLLGKYVHVRPELTLQYYSMLIGRILDTGVSVRKRVIKILKDICVTQHDFPKIPDICVRIIRRVNDEDGIKKLVHEVFQNMWFTPVSEKESDRILKKVHNITDVVAACSSTGYDWFEQLLTNLLKNKDDANFKPVLKSCRQIVDCLVENLLSSEEAVCYNDNEEKRTNKLLVPCITTLYLFAKIYPPLMINHAMTLQPYLSMKCQTQGDQLVLMNVTRTMELVVPLMDHPSESFLAQLEEDMIKLIFCKSFRIVQCCVSCLGAIVNSVTKNYKLVRDSFQRFFDVLTKMRKEHSENNNSEKFNLNLHHLRRSLFTTGLFCQHFDLSDEEVGGKHTIPMKQNVFDCLMYFMRHELEDVQFNALTGIGFMVIRHYELMLEKEVCLLYSSLITNSQESVQLTVQVLKNLQKYLTEEETKMLKTESEWNSIAKKENLKEMGDIASGMASTIIQVYLKKILEACVNVQGTVRSMGLQVIQLIIDQGLVHPVQIVPYLICLSTDVETLTRNLADKLLAEITKKFPGFVQMKSLAGVKMSYKLHNALNPVPLSATRGFRKEDYSSLNNYLYSTLRVSRQHRRAFTSSLLKLFEEQVKTPVDELIYYSDNLSYFPYQVQDEPLFIIHHIDVMISVSGSNLLQTFKENLKPVMNAQISSQIEYDDEDDDFESVIKRLPEDTAVLEECMAASIGCRILLAIKLHLKDMYGFTDGKIQRYSPSEAGKAYERPVNRKQSVVFNPDVGLEALEQANTNALTGEEGRVKLLQQYLDFKQLMLSLDPADDDDADEDEKVTKKPSHVLVCEPVKQNGESIPNEHSKQYNNINNPSAPTSITSSLPHEPSANQSKQEFYHSRKLGSTTIIIKPPKPLKPKVRPVTPKEKKKKKKKRKHVIESEEENESDSSDPDWS